MGWTDGLGGAILGTGASIFSAKQANKANKRLQADAQDFTREQMQNAHQWQVEDLKNAGLNPVLSATDGTHIGGSPTVTGSAQADIAGSAKNIATAIKEMELLDSQKNNINEDTRLKEIQGGKTQSEADINQIEKETLSTRRNLEILLNETTNAREKQEIQNKIVNMDKNRQEIEQIKSNMTKINQEISNMQLQAENLRKEGKIKEAEIIEKNIKNKYLKDQQRWDLKLKKVKFANETAQTANVVAQTANEVVKTGQNTAKTIKEWIPGGKYW